MNRVSIKYTPNPNSVQFLVEYEWISVYWECQDKETAQKSPLTKDLWSLSGVLYLLVGKNFIIINKSHEADWTILIPLIMEKLSNFLFSNKYIFPISQLEVEKCIKDYQRFTESKNFSDFESRLDAFLDEKIRPALRLHGGGLHLVKFDSQSGVVFLKLIGACVNCPNASLTVTHGIKNVLQIYFNTVKDVQLVD